MTIGGGGPIVGRAIIVALGQDQEAAADASDATAARAALDDADLRQLERVDYYGETPAVAPQARPAPRRRFLDRVFRR